MRYLNILIFVLFLYMSKEETHPSSFCQIAHLESGACGVLKTLVSEFPSAAYAMILIIHRFYTANSPTC